MRIFTRVLLTVALMVSAFAFIGPAPAADPYPASVPTKCRLHILRNTYPTSRALRASMRVLENSNGNPKGRVQVTFSRKQAGGFAKVRRTKRYYPGHRTTWSFKGFNKPGRYRMKVHFNPSAKSRFRDCVDTDTVRIRRAN